MLTGVSAPRSLVLICEKTICFAKTEFVGGGGGGGGQGVRQMVCHLIAVARIQFPAANRRRDETMVSVGSIACNESKDRQKDILLFVP